MNERIAVVSGANRGIGLEISRQLAQAGVRVVMTARNTDKGKAACQTLSGATVAPCFHPLDVTCDASVAALAAYLQTEFSRLDILVNNAGILRAEDDGAEVSVLDQSMECFEDTLATNFYGQLRVCQALVPLFKRSPGGRIVNISSGLSQLHQMQDKFPAYTVSKTALNALTRMLADATRADGVLVNAALPGIVATDMGGPRGRPLEEGADTPVWLALLPDDGPTGQLFYDREQVDW